MNSNVIYNFSKLKPSLFFLPLFLLLTLVVVLYTQGPLNATTYLQIQKEAFFYINHHLGQFPTIEYNLTQLGDASILLSFLTIFILYAPKIWESLLSASLFSLLFSTVLKNLFLVPRPSEVYDNSSFFIVGKTAVGFASLPSGHSITVFTTLTVLLFGFMPKNLNSKLLWIVSLLCVGLLIVVSRVGVGAHHPLDVITGSIIGYISGLLGIFTNQKYNIWKWVNDKRYYPIFILLMLVCGVSLLLKIGVENIIIYYLALISLVVSLYKISYAYIKK